MKITFISCFDNYDIRIKPAIDFFESKGFDCDYVTSNFNHRSKKKNYERPYKNTTLLRVPEYKTNLSIKRIISHIIFSYKAYKIVKKKSPDIVYMIIPPNFLVYLFKKIYLKNNTKVIYDVYDMWPETFPTNKKNKIINSIFLFWSGLRTKNIKYSNVILNECKLFKDKIDRDINSNSSEVLYLCGEDLDESYFSEQRPLLLNSTSDEIIFSYIGSINNILDIDLTTDILHEVNKIKKVKFLIIGDGEKKSELLNNLDRLKINYEHYGLIYDNELKKEILQKSMFGINLMKDTVFVGLTMKSIEYFKNGIPIINNIKYDTQVLVENYGAGFNFKNDKEEIVKKILEHSQYENIFLKENTKKLYKKVFSQSAYNSNMEKIWGKYLI